MRNRRNESGQVVVLTVLSMGILIGFMAMAIDVGLLFRAKRNVQIAADAAAIAGAMDLMYNNSTSTAKTAGKAAAVANGIPSADVTINTPPAGGPNAGNGGYVEAIITQPVATEFMGYLSGITSIGVSARAVAGTPTASTACIYITDPTASDALDLQGAYDIEMPGCGLYVNSNASNAVKVTGNGGTLNAAAFNINGGLTGHQTSPTAPNINAAPESDPLGSLSGPIPPGGCTQTSALTSVTTANQSTVSGSSGNGVVCFTKAVTIGSGVSLPGAAGGVVYLFENGVTIGGTSSFGSGTYNAGTGTFSGTSGAMVDVYSGTFNQGNSVLSIYAPTSGTYNGIALFQPASNTTELQVQFGSGNEVLDGYIYAPGAEVYLQDHGGGITAVGIIADTMFDKASTIRIPSYNLANPSTTPLRKITMVE